VKTIEYLIIGFIAGFILTRFWDWFAYSPTVESVWNFFYDLIYGEK